MQAFANRGPEAGAVVAPGVIAGTDWPSTRWASRSCTVRHNPEVQNGPIFEQAQLARAAALGLGIDSRRRSSWSRRSGQRSVRQRVRRILTTA
jgi:hypothetical protein